MDILSWREPRNLGLGGSTHRRTASTIRDAWDRLCDRNVRKGVSGNQECEVRLSDFLLDVLGDDGMEYVIDYLNNCYSGHGAPSTVFDGHSRVIRISWVQ